MYSASTHKPLFHQPFDVTTTRIGVNFFPRKAKGIMARDLFRFPLSLLFHLRPIASAFALVIITVFSLVSTTLRRRGGRGVERSRQRMIILTHSRSSRMHTRVRCRHNHKINQSDGRGCWTSNNPAEGRNARSIMCIMETLSSAGCIILSFVQNRVGRIWYSAEMQKLWNNIFYSLTNTGGLGGWDQFFLHVFTAFCSEIL